jgi:hypothetical protein
LVVPNLTAEIPSSGAFFNLNSLGVSAMAVEIKKKKKNT